MLGHGREVDVGTAADELDQLVVTAEGLFEALDEELRAPHAHRAQQVVLVGEVPVEHGLGDAGAPDDVRDRRIGTVLVDDRDRGPDELAAPDGALTVPPGAPAVDRGRVSSVRGVLTCRVMWSKASAA